MSPTPDAFSARMLLENSTWLSNLARRLVTDEQRADDIVQEAWLALLESPPKQQDTPRAWLATVARRLASKGFRSEARRFEREQKAARPETSGPECADIIERAEMHKRLVDTVMALGEPYRSTLLEHYFDDKSAVEIAARRRQPPATIRSQIARGLDQLRARLDDLHGGDRRAWCLSLLPLAIAGADEAAAAAATSHTHDPAPHAAPKPLRSWIVPAAAGVAFLLVGWLAVSSLLSESDRLESAAPELAQDDTSKNAAIEISEADSDQLSEIGGMAPIADDDGTTATAIQAPATPRGDKPSAIDNLVDTIGALTGAVAEADGIVLDAFGDPVAGINVYLDRRREQGSPSAAADARSAEHPPLATTDGSGHFVVRSSELTSYMYLLAESDKHTTLRRGWFQLPDGDEPPEILIVVAPRSSLAGTVHNEDGEPLEATVTIDAPHAQLIDFPESLENTGPMTIVTTADANGKFELSSYPDFEGATLEVSHDGYRRARSALSTIVDLTHVAIVLEARSAPKKNTVRGVVLYPDRTEAPGVRVQFGNYQTKTDDYGEFTIHAPTMIYDTTPLVAVERGRIPAVLENFGKGWKERDPAEFVELVLGDEPLSIAGVLVDAAGKPQIGWNIRLVDATQVSVGQYPATYAENLAGGGGDSFMTGLDGRFEIGGLLDRDYRIFVYQDRTLLSMHSDPIAAGTTDLRLELPAETTIPELKGRVVSRRGHPLEGISVHAQLALQEDTHGSVWISSPMVRTDRAGYFVLEECPLDGIAISASGDGIMPASVKLGDDPGADLLTIEVAERCRFRINADQLAELPDSAQFFDAAGKTLSVYRFVAGGNSASSRTDLVEGRTPVLAVSEDATTVVLSVRGTEVARIPVTLNPDEVTTITP